MSKHTTKNKYVRRRVRHIRKQSNRRVTKRRVTKRRKDVKENNK